MSSNFLRSTTTLILILCALSSIAIALVLDTDGDPLLNGGEYYMLPQTMGVGISLRPKEGNDSLCPLYVTLDKSSRGIPVIIRSSLRIDSIVPTFPINIVFKDTPNVCIQPLGWRVVHDDSADKSYITTGGKGGESFSSDETFTIQIAEKGYAIQFDANESNVGIFNKDGLLGITSENPLFVMFMKSYKDVLAMKV